MTLLILLTLAAIAITYGICFLIFKLVWKLFNKDRNKWPLILSGICTVTVWGLIILSVYVVVSMISAPFKGMIEEVATHPQPVYGEHVYQDATYPVSLDVFDGMQFSDWMKIKEFDVKIGMDLNAFRKLPHQQAHPLTMNVLARYAQPNKGEEALFKQTDDLIAQAVKDRKLQVTEQTRLMLDGKPAYFIKGTLATNRGMSDVAGALVYVNDQEAYMTAVAGFGGASDAAKMEKTVKSLRLR